LSGLRGSFVLCADDIGTCRHFFKRTVTARYSWLGLLWGYASLPDRCRRSGNAFLEFPWMEPTGRLRLVLSGHHARVLCRQSIGLGSTPGKNRRPLDGGSGRSSYSCNMAIMAAETS
jgi:hypothetical protein